MKVWAHTLVKNEERYIWFSVASVASFVDKILLWDTASTDNTLLIIKELQKKYKEKIEFEEVSFVNSQSFTEVRQKMLERTKSDWFIIVDGDEVWWEDSIKKIRDLIEKKGEQLETIVNRYYNVLGDIYHYQEEKAGRYEIDGKVGHLTIRAVNRRIPGLHFGKPHGQQGIFDKGDNLIQFRNRSKRLFLDEKLYMHFTHMIRSKDKDEDFKVVKRSMKLKYELGMPFPRDFYFPEVFFRPYPEIVKSVWFNRSLDYVLKATFLTPFRYLKRRFLKGKSGY